MTIFGVWALFAAAAVMAAFGWVLAFVTRAGLNGAEKEQRKLRSRWFDEHCKFLKAEAELRRVTADCDELTRRLDRVTAAAAGD